MPDPPAGHNQVIAQLRREFCDGLPARIRLMEAALDDLTGGYDPASAERFYVAAHSLKGTAASYGAAEVSGHAAILSDLARGWIDGGAAAARELSDAAEEIVTLRGAVERYAAAVADEGA